MSVRSVPLSACVLDLHSKLKMPAPPQPIFPDPEPVLHSDRVNKILWYSGGFNPGHIGHHQELQAAFKHFSTSNPPVAAIIAPLEDDIVHDKAQRTADKNDSGRDIWLSCEDRAALWAGTEKVWAIPITSPAQFKAYLVKLCELVAPFEFEIELVSVVGTEYVEVGHSLNPKVGNLFSNIVCSNATRPVSFEYEDGIPQELTWCWKWRLEEETGEGAEKVKLWACQIIGANGKELRYVQFAQPPMLSQDMSATKIRKTIMNGGDFEQDPLKALTLRPELLKSMTWNWVVR